MRHFMMSGVALLAATLFVATAHAQNENRDRLQDRQAGAKTESLRASEVIGMNVQNAEGESIGEINDVVLDARTGEVRYAALSVGGVLGIGDKLFAVPWKQFECRKSEDGDERELILNVDQERLENAPGFEQDNWPDFANREFTDMVDKYYSDDQPRRQRPAPPERDN